MAGKGRWTKYAERFGTNLSEMFNQDIRETLKAGVRTLVTNTVQDSGRAAYHWVLIPNNGRKKPGSWKQMTFRPAYRTPPVGAPGDKRSQSGNKQIVINAVVERETNRTIDATVRGRTGQATVFAFHSAVPEQYNDLRGDSSSPANGQNYREAAQLEEAKEMAIAQMERKWRAQIAKGNVRKNSVR